MKIVNDENGMKNSFGFYDQDSKEIVLKRPYSKKSDLEEALSWIDLAVLNEFNKISIGIGAVESFVADDSYDGMYISARDVIKQTIDKTKVLDNEMLRKVLMKLKDYDGLRNLGFKCFVFGDGEDQLFDLLVEVIKKQKELVYLDLTGCYFNDEQLLVLASVASKSYVAHMVWPEPRVNGEILSKVVGEFEKNLALVVVRGAPTELVEIAQKNREVLFSLVKRSSTITDNDVNMLKKYRNSIRLAVGFEKQKIREMEKMLEGILV